MKKIITFILAILLAGGLSSCGKEDASQETVKNTVKKNTQDSAVTAEDVKSQEDEKAQETEDDPSLYISYYSPVSLCYAGEGMVAFEVNNKVKYALSYSSVTKTYTNWGYADITGKVVIPPSYAEEDEEMQTFNNGAIMKKSSNGTKILYNTKGEMIADFSEYDAVGEVSDGMFWVYKVERSVSGNVGSIAYFDISGKEMIPFHKGWKVLNYYSNSSEGYHSNFRNGLALVFTENGRKLINAKGEYVTLNLMNGDDTFNNSANITPMEIRSYDTTDKYIVVKLATDVTSDNGNTYKHQKSTVGIVDSQGNTWLLDTETETGHDSRYLISMGNDDYSMSDGTVNFFDRNHCSIAYYSADGNMMLDSYRLPCLTGNNSDIYNGNIYSGNFSEGAACLRVTNSAKECYACVIDKNGNLLFNPLYNVDPAFYNYSLKGIAEYHDGLCPARNLQTGKWGYLDKEGNWAMEAQYDSADNFCDGYAIVNNCSVIDTAGSIVLTCD